MSRPILEADFLALDLARVRPPPGTSRVVSWSRGGALIGSARIRSVDSPAGLILSYAVRKGPVDHPNGSTDLPEHHGDDPEECGEHPIPARQDVCHRLSFRSAMLHFGERQFFACPLCNERARVLWLPRKRPNATPRCRTCTGAVYSCDVHYRLHPLSSRRRALRLIERGQDLLTRPRLRAARRARGIGLLRAGELQLRQLLLDVAARGLEAAHHLEARLEDAREPRRSA